MRHVGRECSRHILTANDDESVDSALETFIGFGPVSGLDVIGLRLNELPPPLVKAVLETYPRENMKANLLADLIAYLEQNPAGGGGYWMGQIAERHVPSAHTFDMEMALRAAPFRE